MSRNIFILLAFFTLPAAAQEGLKPLGSNLSYLYRQEASVRQVKLPAPSARQQTTSIQLPFKDDFYYASVSAYPSMALWEDSLVFVNAGFPINPPSIGVATFDGLNKRGYPHEPTLLNMTISRGADTLTSRPINLLTSGTKTLQPSDSVALVFYYQARGYGDSPESTDELMVDFFDADSSEWVKKVWFESGNKNSNVYDTAFKKAFIRISDPKFFRENFQFRIRNFATTAGNFDHWHVDYIHLDQNLNHDTAAPLLAFNDLAFAYVPTPLLYDYSAMPFNQYRAGEMTDLMRVWIRSNNDGALGAIPMTYDHDVFDSTGQIIHSYKGGPGNVISFADTGYSDVKAHSAINLQSNTEYKLSLLNDSADFSVRHVIYRKDGASNDEFFTGNDTVWQFQRFRNYYAYDDGSAEAGYYVLGSSAKIAMQFRLNETDTLRALRIYFDPVGELAEAQATGFRIMVWEAGTSGPAAIQHSLTTVYTQTYINKGFKSIPEFKLQQPLTLQAGIYYIGIQQQAEPVTIGFDRNYDSHALLYFDSGNGWTQSVLPGSLMIRPVFGRYIAPPVGISEKQPQKKFRLYPNPANDTFIIDTGEHDTFSYQVVNALGALQLQGKASGKTMLNTSGLPEGIYFVMVSAGGSAFSSQKLIIRH